MTATAPALLRTSKLRVHAFSISIDGYGAGPNQDVDNPLGAGGMALHKWVFATKTFQREHGEGGGEGGVDDDFAARGLSNIGAWILGRNMFGSIRGPWPDDPGRDGGARTRRTTLQSSFSRTTPGHRSRWRVERHSTS